MPSSERRTQLLKLAKDIVNSGGIGALTMSALAERAGTAKPIVYSHFSNSEDVAVALLDEYFAEQARYVVSRLGDPADLRGYLRELVEALFAFHRTDHLSVRSITNGFSSTSKVNEAYMAHQLRTKEAFRELLSGHGILDPDLEVASYGLMTLIRETSFEFVGRVGRNHCDAIKKMTDGIADNILK
jgi:AcrR family transcriptional regulator